MFAPVVSGHSAVVMQTVAKSDTPTPPSSPRHTPTLTPTTVLCTGTWMLESVPSAVVDVGGVAVTQELVQRDRLDEASVSQHPRPHMLYTALYSRLSCMIWCAARWRCCLMVHGCRTMRR